MQVDLEAPVELTAGPLAAFFYRGDLRYVSVNGAEVLRRIYVAVRDVSWGTVPPVLTNVRLERRGDGTGFRIEYDAEHRRGDIDFAWHSVIIGEHRPVNGRVGEVELRFEMDGLARSDFRTNRTGICVHHPPPAAKEGEECLVEHVDGSTRHRRLPWLISPHQPFTDVRMILHRAAKVRFEGEVFETEDQRNWTDSSFKTYCRPLSLPFPYVLKKGEQVRHSVLLTTSVASPPASIGKRVDVTRVRVDPQRARPLPAIGVRRGATGRALSHSERESLKALNLSHLRTDLHLGQPGWEAELRHSASDAEAIHVPLELGLHVGEAFDASLSVAVQHLARCRPAVSRVIVYENGKSATSRTAVAAARRYLADVLPRVPVGGGTAGNFAELNRNRPPAGSLFNLLAWPVNPQVHASDDLSLMENIAAQGDTVRTARAFAPACRFAVGPVTLHRVPDAFAAGNDPTGEVEQVGGDPRQKSAFGAAWSLGSIHVLAMAAADSITYYESVGPFGLMAEGGQVLFPLYRVFADVGEFAGGEVLGTSGGDRLRACALALRKDDRLRVLVANLHWQPQRFRLDGVVGYRPANGASSPWEAELPPYHVARLDFVEDSNTLRT